MPGGGNLGGTELHALSVEAGHWEKVTENRRIFVPLDGGHHIPRGFGPSEGGAVYSVCNSVQGHG